VAEYSEWQQEQVQDPTLKGEVQKAEDVVLGEGFDLEQIYRGRNSGFLIDKGVKRGIANCFVDDIPIWNKRRKASRTERDE
jgi:hypothetical protein